MKNLSLFLMAFLFAFTAFAQDETETLLGSDKIRVSGFGSPIVGWGSLNGEFGTFSGGGGAVLFNQKLFIGGYGLGLSNRINFKNNSEIDFNHGGFWVGYHFMPKKLIHFVASTRLGWGEVSLYDQSSSRLPTKRDNIFIVEPEIGAEVNIAKFFKISLTGAYRIASGANLAEVTNENLNGYTVYMTFKFGWFR